MNQDHLDKMTLLLVSGISRESALEVAAAKMGLTKAEASRLVTQAARRLTLAARYNRDRELGAAITRLNDCYKKSLAIQDIKTCLSVQRELNRLLDLYRHEPPSADSSASPEEQRARGHLAPLFPDGENLPLSELCRLAAGRILAP